MSLRLFGDDVIFFQRLLKSAGLLKKPIDGRWGSDTDQASDALDQEFKSIAKTAGSFDSRTESLILTLHPKAQGLARLSLNIIRSNGIDARIISGTRSYADQNKLFAQGRFGNPGKIVTKARGGQSNHNFCIAWDIGIFNSQGKYLDDSPLYGKAGKIISSAGVANLEWGGDWVSFADKPHYQHATGLSISQVRAKFEAGLPIV